MPNTWDAEKFADACRGMGYSPFKAPSGIASTSYVNEYGMQMGPCNFCGFCERFGCYQYSKSSPQTAILGALKRQPNFTYRTHAEVLRVEMAGDGRTARGVTYFDEAAQEEVFQPADIVILASYQLNNVHLLLLSGIGEVYNPVTGDGVTGKSYGYQMNGGISRSRSTNPFVATANCMAWIFRNEQYRFRAEGFIGIAYWRPGHSTDSRSGPCAAQGTPMGGRLEGRHQGVVWPFHVDGLSRVEPVYVNNYMDLNPTIRTVTADR